MLNTSLDKQHKIHTRIHCQHLSVVTEKESGDSKSGYVVQTNFYLLLLHMS